MYKKWSSGHWRLMNECLDDKWNARASGRGLIYRSQPPAQMLHNNGIGVSGFVAHSYREIKAANP